jgi:predicted dehydrogenase
MRHHHAMKHSPRQSVFLSSDPKKVSRRQFFRTTAIGAAAMSFPFVGNVLGANDRINCACIGVAGKGDSDTDDTARCGGNLVALCDVDERHLKAKGQKFPQAKLYRDFRKMFDEMGPSIDAVTVSIPDHCHGIASALAMSLGKHVYCQKPLTQTIVEARQLRDLAANKKVATQMGNQGSASGSLRRGVEIIQAGVLGPVRELHIWTNRPIWPQGLNRPPGEDPVPQYLNWDAWIGPAPMRPFKEKVYHDFVWRGWHDFGTGALGDMACHMVNMPFRALKMGYPHLVVCEETSTSFPETYPKTSRIRFEFPQREGLPPLKFWWYDGNPDDKSVAPLRPPPELTREILDIYAKIPEGVLVVGDKGTYFSPTDSGANSVLKLQGEKGYTATDKHEAVRAVPQSIPRSPGHNEEWFRMMRDGTPAYSNFAIASKLTEIILLGCVAMRVGPGKEMQWDGEQMASPNCPEAAQYLRRHNREGWMA